MLDSLNLLARIFAPELLPADKESEQVPPQGESKDRSIRESKEQGKSFYLKESLGILRSKVLSINPSPLKIEIY